MHLKIDPLSSVCHEPYAMHVSVFMVVLYERILTILFEAQLKSVIFIDMVITAEIQSFWLFPLSP